MSPLKILILILLLSGETLLFAQPPEAPPKFGPRHYDEELDSEFDNETEASICEDCDTKTTIANLYSRIDKLEEIITEEEKELTKSAQSGFDNSLGSGTESVYQSFSSEPFANMNFNSNSMMGGYGSMGMGGMSSMYSNPYSMMGNYGSMGMGGMSSMYSNPYSMMGNYGSIGMGGMSSMYSNPYSMMGNYGSMGMGGMSSMYSNPYSTMMGGYGGTYGYY